MLETKPNSKSAEEAEEAEEVEDNSQTKVIPMHTVEKGENLFAISKLYNIVMKSLARWNNLPAPYVLKVGDVLYLAEPEPAEQSQ